jgi:hypothetical protein
MKSFPTGVRSAVAVAAMAGLGMQAQAEVEEDSSASFERANSEMSAAMGLPSAESTVITHANGMTSARMGLEAMKMLVVRQNPDGSFSYDHAGSESEAQELMQNSNTTRREEQ